MSTAAARWTVTLTALLAADMAAAALLVAGRSQALAHGLRALWYVAQVTAAPALAAWAQSRWVGARRSSHRGAYMAAWLAQALSALVAFAPVASLPSGVGVAAFTALHLALAPAAVALSYRGATA